MLPKPKKRLGQNFLHDNNVLNKILSACEIRNNDLILEIGSGTGNLTCQLASQCAKLYAVEIDAGLIASLKERLSGLPNVTIVNKDFLKLDLRRLLRNIGDSIKIIGNIPYYISSPILGHIFKFKDIAHSAFLTVQKEFALRLSACAGSKDYGALSCFARYYSEPKILFLIKKNCFYPVPKVDSAFIQLKIKKELPLKNKKEKLLFQVIHAAFNQRRKTLRNSLRDIIKPPQLEAFFLKHSINPDIRPEDLNLNDFISLCSYCPPKKN